MSDPFPPSRCCALSIPARLVIVCAAALAAIGCFTLPSLLFEESARARADLADRVERHVQFVLPALAEHVVSGDYEVLRRMLAQTARRNYVGEVRWVDFGGTLLRAAGEAPELRAPDWFVRVSGIGKVERSLPVEVGGRLYGRVEITGSPAFHLNEVWEEFLATAELLLLAAGVLLALVLGVALRTLRPLGDLAAAARALGAGDHSVRVAEPGPPELAGLARAFNAMAADLARSFASLREALAANRLLATVVRQSNAAIITKDLEGRITTWNEGAERIFGYSAQEAIGQPVAILHPPGHGEEFGAVLSRMRAAEPRSFEAERRAKDGSAVLVASNVSPLHDAEGRHVGEISVIQDITEKRRAAQALFEAQERARVALDAIADGVIRLDAAGRIEYLNGAAERITGWSAAEAIGRPADEVFRLANACVLPRSANGGAGEELQGEVTLTDRAGRVRPVEHSRAPLRQADGTVDGEVVVLRDVGKLRRLARQLSWQAGHDALTGLPNRRVFEERLRDLVEDARIQDAVHSVCYVDLDQFKVVNDTCGHVAGDEMLRQIAAILQPCLRASDTLARLGGDEFGVLLEHCPLDRAETVAQKLLDALEGYRFVWEGKSFAARASIGIAAIEAGASGASEILGAADAACFCAKEQGRNRIRVHRETDEELVRRRAEMGWVSQVSEAISENRLELWCQPIVPVLESGSSASHYEILVRMRAADGKIVPPMAFIPAAERYGLMPALDRRVVALAFEALSARIALEEHSAPAHIAVNLSGLTVADPGFLDFVREQFRRSGLAPGRICFEITETAAIANLSAASRFIAELKSMGCLFSLDDFGSGFSSFAYLKSLPVDYLKIDGSFVKDIETDRVDCAMVEAVNRIGHAMGIHTIAEFVENENIRRMLATMGVDYAQGYGIGKPQPVAQAWARCASSRPMLHVVAAA